VIPLATQHYMLLQRNLIYTGITRGKRLLVLIGQKKALGIAVRNDRPQRRYSGLLASLRAACRQQSRLRSMEHEKEHHHAEATKRID
jgi:exodeoxyribonuclease V alpha subunit